MLNNERSQTATFQRDIEGSFHELRANLESLHTELESSKIGEREERTKMEEQLRAATATLKTVCKEVVVRLFIGTQNRLVALHSALILGSRRGSCA